ncbi:MAG TPA: sigma-54 dependent transcriptional regulator [Candidatus Eisenbacteria bacterium]|jgi:DNA-binding NtrC family response regulator|nr:sigma-54 dependent transcriptional regulator [Candidatus Eisenbacteria bacterium]
MNENGATVLIADDQGDVLEALRLLLKGEGFRVETANSPAGVLHAVDEREFDAVLMDLNYARDTTSGREGLDLLGALRGTDSMLPVVVMTAWGSVEGAVEAMRRGARDYIEKPWDNARLVATLRTHVDLGRALRRSERLESENRMLRHEGLPEMIADSRAMKPVLHLLQRIGPSQANVLITGEHGTGKEVVARWLHGLSPRAGQPLVTVNAGGIAEGVFESELFGHVKGAFTDARHDRIGYFELADQGTLFLDEIGNIPAPQQAKLLRVLQTGELQRVGSSRSKHVDVRVLAATNIDIAREVQEGRFRADLLYRLNTVEIRIPPLRDRPEDIPRLAAHFLARASVRYGKRLAGFTEEAMRALSEHGWPGNVRELEHAVERSVLLTTREDRVGAQDLLLRPASDGAARLETMTLEEVERYLIRRALDRHEGNVSRAADALGLSRSALYRRLQQYDLTP